MLPSGNNPYAIIADAYLDAGKRDTSDVLNGDQLASGMRRLADLINFFQTQGIKLWTLVDTPVPLVSGQALYSFLPGGNIDMTRPLRVIQGYYLDVSGNQRPLAVMAQEEYLRLSRVTTNPGAINSYYVDKRVDRLNVTFWLTPDATAATGVAHVMLQTQVVKLSNFTDEVLFPDEWRLALRWGLADDLCTGQPQIIMDRCERMAMKYREALEGWDVEDAATTFAPDARVYSGTGRFR